MDANYALIILSYNHPDLTEKCVQSVLDLQFPVKQIFLVHNGSEKKWSQQLKNNFPQIQHILLPINKGFTGGANAGLQEVFKIFDQAFFLTNDTEVRSLPSHFPMDYDLISPMILKRKTETIDSIMGVIDLNVGHLKHIRHLNELTTLKPSQTPYAPGTAFGVTKKCFIALSGFDESFHTYWEDVDFSLRAQDQNFILGHSDLFQLRHKIGKTCHKDRFYTLYLFQRNRRRLMQKRNLAGLRFYISYFITMLKLLSKIILKPNRQAPLGLWWKALYE